MMVHLTERNFKEEVLDWRGLAVVDFWANWCGPCRMLSPVLEELATKYNGQIKIGKLNVEDAPRLATQYAVMSVPTLIFFKDGKIMHQIVGLVSKAELEKRILSLI